MNDYVRSLNSSKNAHSKKTMPPEIRTWVPARQCVKDQGDKRHWRFEETAGKRETSDKDTTEGEKEAEVEEPN